MRAPAGAAGTSRGDTPPDDSEATLCSVAAGPGRGPMPVPNTLSLARLPHFVTHIEFHLTCKYHPKGALPAGWLADKSVAVGNGQLLPDLEACN